MAGAASAAAVVAKRVRREMLGSGMTFLLSGFAQGDLPGEGADRLAPIEVTLK
jgi:hypothetical protein